MSAEMPLATLRLACDLLDPDKVSRILLHDEKGVERAAERGIKVKGRIGIWLASTDGVTSPRFEDHLQALISLVSPSLVAIRL